MGLSQEKEAIEGDMIYYDGGRCSPSESFQFFQAHRGDIGDIVEVERLGWDVVEGHYYPMRIRGEMGEIWLSGCGTCMRRICLLCQELGYTEDCWLTSGSDGFILGPPSKPVVQSCERREVSARAEEVYEAIEEYMEEYGEAPVAAEIAERTSIEGRSTVYGYLRELEDANWIHRRRYCKRGIELI